MMKHCSFLLALLWLYTSCDKPYYCGEVRGIETSSSLLIYPFHVSMDKYFYPEIESRSPFKRDSLQVTNEDGKPFPFVSFLLESDPRNTLEGFYAIKLAPAFWVPQDNDAFTEEKTRYIYLKYNYNTSDTLKLVFKAYKNKCDVGIYEYLNIYHRNKLIFSKTNEIAADFALNH